MVTKKNFWVKGIVVVKMDDSLKAWNSGEYSSHPCLWLGLAEQQRLGKDEFNFSYVLTSLLSFVTENTPLVCLMLN